MGFFTPYQPSYDQPEQQQPAQPQGPPPVGAQWAQDYVNNNNISPTWGNANDLTTIGQNYLDKGYSDTDAQSAAVNYLGWGQQPQQQAAPSYGGGGGNSGGGLFNPNYYTPFQGQAPGDFSSYLSRYPMPSLPQFQGPAYKQAPEFSYADFKAPTLDEAKSQPGYQFGVDEGLKALQQSAASKGLLRTGGTLKDIENYGRNAATQNYGNVLQQNLGIYNTNRSGEVQKYNTNYNTQYADPYKAQFAEAQAEYAPQLLKYQNDAANSERQAEFGYNSDWAKYLDTKDTYYSNQSNPFSKYLSLAQIGAANA